MRLITAIRDIIIRHPHTVAISIFAILFASWLMFSTLSYRDGAFIIDSKLWADFLAHLPMIKSFAEGDNFPPEYPIYAGEPIRYHFLFYFLVGMLVRIGFNPAFALNILSSIGFAGLIIALFFLAKRLTRSYLASWLSVLFLLFNPSLQWAYFLSKLEGRPILETLFTQEQFASFGPWSGDLLSAFWHLNIFTNQRHLAFSFLAMFIAIWSVYYSKWRQGWVVTALIIGILAFMHKAILMVLFVILGLHFLIRSNRRFEVFVALIAGTMLAIPGIIYLNGEGGTDAKSFEIVYGFLFKATEWREFPTIENSFVKWIVYWFINTGFLTIVALGGAILLFKSKIREIGIQTQLLTNTTNILPKKLRAFFTHPRFLTWYDRIFNEQTVWFLSATVVFALANIFAFSIDMAANHKLVNYSIMIWGIYAAYVIALLFRRKWFDKFIAAVLVFVMTISGVVDIFPIINDEPQIWQDAHKLEAGRWIQENTQPDDSFFNATYEVAPVLLSGRKTMWGWDYLIWSIGYDVETRKQDMQEIITGMATKDEVCSYLQGLGIDYVYKDGTVNFLDVPVNHEYFQNMFINVYTGDYQVQIYDVEKTCNLP